MKYDVAIIGTGPAGLSAALNLQLHNKSIIWFGSKELSVKVEKAEVIANYPGLPKISGADLNKNFKKQIEEAGLTITDKMVTNIAATKSGFMILGDNEIYEASTILLATGAVSAKEYENEARLLGKGVSYCATCDGFLYKGKTIFVVCGAKRYEHEVSYLAEMAEKVYLVASYPDCEVDLPNVEKVEGKVKALQGDLKVESVLLSDGTEYNVDGVFLLRTSVAPTSIISGIEMDGPHIVVDSRMQTTKPGVYAAGDCVGRPYQIAKAVGEGNIAAQSILGDASFATGSAQCHGKRPLP